MMFTMGTWKCASQQEWLKYSNADFPRFTVTQSSVTISLSELLLCPWKINRIFHSLANLFTIHHEMRLKCRSLLLCSKLKHSECFWAQMRWDFCEWLVLRRLRCCNLKKITCLIWERWKTYTEIINLNECFVADFWGLPITFNCSVRT